MMRHDGGLMTEMQSDGGGEIKRGIPRLIVLDDNPAWGNFVSEVAGKVGFSASYATTHGEYAGTADSNPPDVLILDLFMPEKDGIEMIADMAQTALDRPLIILMSGHSSALLTSAVRLGQSKGLEIVGSLVKPFRLAELRMLLQKAASLVERKRQRGKYIVAANEDAGPSEGPRGAVGEPWSVQPDDACPRRSNPESRNKTRSETTALPLVENSSLKILRDQLNGVRTAEIIKHSIAAINARFCLALWQTHLATLCALNDVPGRLAEAADAVIGSGRGTEQADRWRQALRTNMRTLVNNRDLIRQVANSLRLGEHGRLAIESIDNVNVMVADLLSLENARRDARRRMVARYEDICVEKDRIGQALSALHAGLQEAVRRGRNASGAADSGSSPMTAAGREIPT